MNQTPISCANCGAIMQPEVDGRTYACGYCRTRIEVAIDGSQIAAGLSLNQRFEALTNALAQHSSSSARAARVLARITGRG